MKKYSFKSGLILALCGFLLYLAIHYWPFLSDFALGLLGAGMPLIIGFGIAYIVNIVMSAYERWFFRKAKKKWLLAAKRPLCMLLSFLSFGAIVAIVVGLVLPQLIECFELIFGLLPDAINKVIDFFGRYDLLSDEVLAALDAIDWKSRVQQLVDVLTSGFSNVVEVVYQALQGVISGVITAFLSFIFSIYLLLSKEKLKNQVSRLCAAFLPPHLYLGLLYVTHNLNVSFRRYLIGQCTEAVILGVLCSLGMLILGLPYAAMIGALIAFTALIPIAGAYIGAFIGAFMILTVSPIKALIFLIFLVVLQQLEGNLIYPRVVGDALGMPGIWVLAAITVGGGIAGIPGMFLGVPLVAAIYRMVGDALHKREQEDESDRGFDDAPPAEAPAQSPTAES